MAEQVKTVLILSDAPAPDALISAFAKRGFSPIVLPAGSSKLPDRTPVAIVVIVEKPSAQIDRTLTSIKARYLGLNIPFLALLPSTPSIHTNGQNIRQNDNFDSILIAPYHPAQIVQRIIGLTRLASMEQEIKLRLQTLEQDFSIFHQRPKIQRKNPFNILFIGKASPEFMVVINALQRKNVRVVAAFTSFTAFDYLYEQTFDAVVMNGLVSMDSALSVTDTMRKNAKLYHVPTLLLANKMSAKEQKTVYSAGINDIIDASAPLGDISARVLEQANFHRMHSTLKDEFSVLGGDMCMDSSTQLFNKTFFNAHLSRVVKFYDAQNLPVTLCLIRITPDDNFNPDIAIGASFAQIGIMIKNLVRLQDITARIETNVFAIAFPGQSAEQLKSVSERLSSILECATLSAPDTGEPLNIKLELTMTTLNTDISQTSAA